MENMDERAFWFISFGILLVAIVISLIDRARAMSVILLILLAVIYALYKIGGNNNGRKGKDIQSDHDSG